MKEQRKDPVLLMGVGKVIADLRDKKGLTQEDFYLETGIHVGRIEAGKSNPSIITMSEICRFFNISLAQFFKRVE